MDDSEAVFYLRPINKYARNIVHDPANSNRRCEDPNNPAAEPCLRIGLDQQAKCLPRLASFGRRATYCDVILDKGFSRNDQCYFDFHEETGELLLHDLSPGNDTQLREVVTPLYAEEEKQMGRGVVQSLGPFLITKTPRKCVVLLSPDLYRGDGSLIEREYWFRMQHAEFWLVPPPRTHCRNEEAMKEKKLAFAKQADSDKTIERTMQQFVTEGMQSMTLTATDETRSFNPHDTRLKTRLEPNHDERIQFTKLRPLGHGGQGVVHEVVDMHSGAHYACKFVTVKPEVPQWNIYSEREFRKRVEEEILMVQALKHQHIVPYEYTQGFSIGQDIQIFMPLYEGSLHGLLQHLREKAPEQVPAMTSAMLRQMLDALDFVHTRDSPVVHRDIKPANILYRGDQFFLTDFGFAKVVNTSRTMVGTNWYVAPEVTEHKSQTTKIDIWGLGVTLVECLNSFKHEPDRRQEFTNPKQWYKYLETTLVQHQHGRPFAGMVAEDANHRPTARRLLKLPNLLADTPWIPERPSLPGQTRTATVTRPTILTPMDWTPTVPPDLVASASPNMPASPAAQPETERRGPGRPRKVPAGSAAQLGAARRGPGRPRKVPAGSAAQPGAGRRGPGRPRKVPASPPAQPGAGRRGPGRPRKDGQTLRRDRSRSPQNDPGLVQYAGVQKRRPQRAKNPRRSGGKK